MCKQPNQPTPHAPPPSELSPAAKATLFFALLLEVLAVADDFDMASVQWKTKEEWTSVCVSEHGNRSGSFPCGCGVGDDRAPHLTLVVKQCDAMIAQIRNRINLHHRELRTAWPKRFFAETKLLITVIKTDSITVSIMENPNKAASDRETWSFNF